MMRLSVSAKYSDVNSIIQVCVLRFLNFFLKFIYGLCVDDVKSDQSVYVEVRLVVLYQLQRLE